MHNIDGVIHSHNGCVVFDTKCVISEPYESNWCGPGATPDISHKNSIKFIYFDTPGSPFIRQIIKSPLLFT